jgi:hypothetical protein
MLGGEQSPYGSEIAEILGSEKAEAFIIENARNIYAAYPEILVALGL